MSSDAFTAVEEVLRRFDQLRRVVTPVTARLHGSWAQVHEPGHPELVSWRYTGAFESTVPIVGILMLCQPEKIDWIRTPPSLDPAGARFDLLVHGWMQGRPYVSVFAQLHFTEWTAFVKDVGRPPDSCSILEGEVEAGAAHEVFRLNDKLRGYVVLLANEDVRTAPFTTWRLHEARAATLSPPLARWMTHKKSGTIALPPKTSG